MEYSGIPIQVEARGTMLFTYPLIKPSGDTPASYSSFFNPESGFAVSTFEHGTFPDGIDPKRLVRSQDGDFSVNQWSSPDVLSFQNAPATPLTVDVFTTNAGDLSTRSGSERGVHTSQTQNVAALYQGEDAGQALVMGEVPLANEGDFLSPEDPAASKLTEAGHVIQQRSQATSFEGWAVHYKRRHRTTKPKGTSYQNKVLVEYSINLPVENPLRSFVGSGVTKKIWIEERHAKKLGEPDKETREAVVAALQFSHRKRRIPPLFTLVNTDRLFKYMSLHAKPTKDTGRRRVFRARSSTLM